MLGLAAEYLTDLISEDVIGQRNAVENTLTAICENFEAYAQGKPGKINNILLVGPSGSGRTHMARSIAKTLGIPFVKVSMNEYTIAEYKENDIRTIVTVDFYDSINDNIAGNVWKMVIRYKLANSILNLLKKKEIIGVKFKIAAEFAAVYVFFGAAKSEELVNRKYDNPGAKSFIRELKSVFQRTENVYLLQSCIADFPYKSPDPFKSFYSKPFGIIFIEEVDKILSNHPLQELISTMLEGTKIHLGRTVDTSHITFMLTGNFSEHSSDEFIPELKRELNIKVKLRKFSFEDYLKIIRKEWTILPEPFKDSLVKVEENALNELAKICMKQNEQEYLGAKRVKENLSRVNYFLVEKVKNSNSFPIKIDESFINQAINSEPLNISEHAYDKKTAINIAEEFNNETKEIGNLFFDWLIEFLKDKLSKEEFKYNLSNSLFHSIGADCSLFFEINSEGKTIFEKLIEENYLKGMESKTLHRFKKYIENHIENKKEELLEKLNKLTEWERTTEYEDSEEDDDFLF